MSDPEAAQSAPKRWSAFVCPDCRFVLRVPRHHDGVGIVCPSCRRMLRIPEEGEVGAPLMAPIKNLVDFSKAVPDLRRRQKRRKKKRVKDSVLPDWESGVGKKQEEWFDWMEIFKTTAVWGISFAVISGCVFLFLKTRESAPGQAEIEEDLYEGKAVIETPVSLTAGFDEKDLMPTGLLKRSEAELLALAEDLARKFLEAERIDEILPLVSDPEDVAVKIRRLYPDGKIESLGFSGISQLDSVVYREDYAAITFLTAGQERKPMVFSEGEDGLKIDWESWVGWADLPWDEIVESKPIKPVMVRVLSKPVPYYNFDFADDSEWVSYRLLSPDDEHMLYGYAKRGSKIDEQLRPTDPKGTIAVTLKVRFPEGAVWASQVIIDEFLADGWVFREESE